MSEVTAWVVTSAANDYNQYGDYLEGVFLAKPTFQMLKKLLPNENDVTLGKLSRGGGRQDVEETWYYLTELAIGMEYHSQ